MVLGLTKKINITPYIITFYWDNDLKLKFVRGEKADILTNANAKKSGIKAKNILA